MEKYRSQPTQWVPGTDRLFNLVITLINYGPRTMTWILDNVDGYDGPYSNTGKDRRKAEQRIRRDRIALAEAGVHIHDRQQGKESVLHVSMEEFALPDLKFTEEEAEVISAAGLWTHSKAMGPAVRSAYAKLAASGVQTKDYSKRLAFAPDLTELDESSMEALFAALSAQECIEFSYYPNLVEEAEDRLLEPWGIGNVQGKLYVTGFDPERQAQRTYRMSRIANITHHHEPRTVQAPEEPITSIIAAGLKQASQLVTVTVEFPGEGALELKAMANAVQADDQLVHTIGPIDRDEIVRLAASYAPDAIITDPPEIVEAVVALLQRAAGGENRG